MKCALTHSLIWASQMVSTLKRVLSREPHELRQHVDTFLRLRGSTKPLERMPSWRWLCARAGHDPKDVLISGSERLRALVQSALIATTKSCLADFPAVSSRVRARLYEEERSTSLTRIEGGGRSGYRVQGSPMVCSLPISESYLRLAWLDLCVVLDGRTALGLAVSSSKRAASGHQERSSGGLSYLYSSEYALNCVGKLVMALHPEIQRDRHTPDYSSSLPFALHPAARAQMVATVQQADGSLGLPALLIDWLRRRQKTISIRDMLQDLEHTAAIWRVCSQLCSQPAAFKSRLMFLEQQGQRHKVGYYPTFNLGEQAGGVIHLSGLLRTVTLFESVCDLRGAIRPAVDYLESSIQMCQEGHARCVSFATCADLIERACCYSLRLAAQWLGSELWIPQSLLDLYLVRQKGTMVGLKTSSMCRGVMRLLSRALEAACRLRILTGGQTQDIPCFALRCSALLCAALSSALRCSAVLHFLSPLSSAWRSSPYVCPCLLCSVLYAPLLPPLK